MQVWIPNRIVGEQYLLESFEGSPIIERMSNIFPKEGNLLIASHSMPPPSLDLLSDWETHPCGDWIVKRIQSFCSRTKNGVVLSEDIEPISVDKNVDRPDGGEPANQRRLYWPITAIDCLAEDIEQVLSLRSTFRLRLFFAILDIKCHEVDVGSVVNTDNIGAIADSVTEVITDVYQGAGYIVWSYACSVRAEE